MKMCNKISNDFNVIGEKEILNSLYWDARENRTVQFMEKDIELVKKLGIALHRGYYLSRVRENFASLRLSTELRETTCALTETKIYTSLPKELDGRIISEEAYQSLI